ncbi:MAG: polysaccharide deacetylase family protein [Butyricicoccus pullicaecorum]|nr:polysaccharide deacetylase family protein [Butyricicoccus pullicaecorum]MDO4668781.1 polysaccharide deacetylase family protein [Butyricicoccus pullicaecorum]
MQLHFGKLGLLRRMAAAVLSVCLLMGIAEAAEQSGSATTAPATDYLPVIMYHHFDSQTGGSKMIVSPARFEEQMTALKNAGYTAVTPQQLVDYVDKGVPLPEKPVWITMDDGYRSNMEVAAPILERNGLKATVYCIGVSVGKSTYKDMGVPIIPHFSYEEVKPWSDKGVLTIQSHTYDMHNVSTLDTVGYRRGVLPRLGEPLDQYMNTFYADFSKSNAGIRQAFGADSLSFAYPFGLHNAITEGMLQAMGVRITVTIREGMNTLVRGDASSLYGMARFNITEDMTGAQLLEKIREPVA